jgi:hypothetical protein
MLFFILVDKMASNDIEAYKPPSFYHHDDIDLKTVGNGNFLVFNVYKFYKISVIRGSHWFVCTISCDYIPWLVLCFYLVQKPIDFVEY